MVCAPGNGGTAQFAENVAIDPEDVDAVVALAKARGIEFAMVGPEAPLVAGLVDALTAAGIDAFGPHKAAARLEGSKAYSKRFMQKHGVPTADAWIFDDADAAAAHVKAHGQALVVKADGLAAGKGVVVASTVAEAHEAIDFMLLDNKLGISHNQGGARVVIEEIGRQADG